jgi:hypothetical protein
MEARVTHRFYGAADGTVYPRYFEVGELIDGDLAHCAIEQGDAIPAKKREAVEPENRKTSSSLPAGQVSQEKIVKPRGRPRLK